MKAKFVCFKLSKTIIGLILIIILQLIFIVIGIKEVREQKSFEQIKENMNNISNLTINEQEENSNTISNEIENKGSENSTTDENQNQKKQQQEEYKSMPQELKGYKVIRKNYNSKTRIRYIYFRRNK